MGMFSFFFWGKELAIFMRFALETLNEQVVSFPLSSFPFLTYFTHSPPPSPLNDL